MGSGKSSGVGFTYNGKALQPHRELDATIMEGLAAASQTGRFQLRLGVGINARLYKDVFKPAGTTETTTDPQVAQQWSGAQLDPNLPFVRAEQTTGAVDFKWAAMAALHASGSLNVYKAWWITLRASVAPGIFRVTENPATVSIFRERINYNNVCAGSRDPACAMQMHDEPQQDTLHPGGFDGNKVGLAAYFDLALFDFQLGQHLSIEPLNVRLYEVDAVQGYGTHSASVAPVLDGKVPTIQSRLSIWWGEGRAVQLPPAISITAFAGSPAVIVEGGTVNFTFDVETDHIPSGATPTIVKRIIATKSGYRAFRQIINEADFNSFAQTLTPGVYRLTPTVAMTVAGKSYEENGTSINLTVNANPGPLPPPTSTPPKVAPEDPTTILNDTRGIPNF